MRPMSTFELYSKLTPRDESEPRDLRLHQLLTKLSDLYDNTTDPTAKETILLLADITNAVRHDFDRLADRIAVIEQR
jgi:hypothetical protein